MERARGVSHTRCGWARAGGAGVWWLGAVYYVEESGEGGVECG